MDQEDQEVALRSLVPCRDSCSPHHLAYRHPAEGFQIPLQVGQLPQWIVPAREHHPRLVHCLGQYLQW